MFRKFLEDQKEEMLKHKWIESEHAGCDLGDAVILEWIRKYAKEFRECWESKFGKLK
mgnify:CR=1 FL=1